jgi:hypothetical protein
MLWCYYGLALGDEVAELVAHLLREPKVGSSNLFADRNCVRKKPERGKLEFLIVENGALIQHMFNIRSSIKMDWLLHPITKKVSIINMLINRLFITNMFSEKQSKEHTDTSL